jgi:transketolase
VKSTRDWFGDRLVEVAEQHDDIVVVNCDLGSATKTLKFKQRFPDRFFECGIAEANAVGIAAGLAQEGYRPFLASFGHFLTGKYLEIFQSVGLNNAGVVLVGTHAGLAIGKDGPTQMGLRDLALMRTLHNLQILHPADGAETRQVLDHVARSRRPTYLRLCRQPQREVHGPGYRFVPGQPDVVHRGADVAIFAMGGMVDVLLGSVEALRQAGIDPTIVNLSSLPLDRGAVQRLAAEHGRVFVVEDHFVKGGISDELARAVLEMDRKIAFGAWGVQDYGQAGSPDDLYARYRLDPPGVTGHLEAFLQRAA